MHHGKLHAFLPLGFSPQEMKFLTAEGWLKGFASGVCLLHHGASQHVQPGLGRPLVCCSAGVSPYRIPAAAAVSVLVERVSA